MQIVSFKERTMQAGDGNSCMSDNRPSTLSVARSSSPAAMTAFSFAGAALVSASSSAATPLYHLYQQSMHLTPGMITLVFAVYAFSLLGALLTVGGLSDYLGRRPVIFGGLLLNAIAMLVFAH